MRGGIDREVVRIAELRAAAELAQKNAAGRKDLHALIADIRYDDIPVDRIDGNVADVAELAICGAGAAELAHVASGPGEDLDPATAVRDHDVVGRRIDGDTLDAAELSVARARAAAELAQIRSTRREDLHAVITAVFDHDVVRAGIDRDKIQTTAAELAVAAAAIAELAQIYIVGIGCRCGAGNQQPRRERETHQSSASTTLRPDSR